MANMNQVKVFKFLVILVLFHVQCQFREFLFTLLIILNKSRNSTLKSIVDICNNDAA